VTRVLSVIACVAIGLAMMLLAVGSTEASAADVTGPPPVPGSPTDPRAGHPVASHDDMVVPRAVSWLPPVSRSAAVPGRARVLAVRIYWSPKPPSYPDNATMRGLMKDTATWFARASRGRHHLSSKVTPWLKVGGGSSNCGLYEPVKRALAAAHHRGIGTRGYNRFMIVAPQCSTNSQGEMPGRVTWIREAKPYLGVLVHELGHNLGLDHANSLICTKSARRVPQAGKCHTEEYGDMWDAMGISSQQYSVPVLRRLGWAGRIASASKSDTWTLRDAAHSGSGIQALRVPSGGSTYWLEYRTDPRALAKSPGSFAVTGVPGLQIRLDTGARSMRILDAAPGNPDPHLSYPDPDLVSPALPEGSSFTTPQKVRITLVSQTDTSATVRITRGVAAQAPDAPSITSAVSSPASGEIRLTVQPGKDNGQVVLGYLLTKYPGGKSEYVSSPGGTATTLSMHGTGDGAPGEWTARAVNQVGTSPESGKTSVHVIAPTVAITSPAPGATVPGPNFAVTVTASPDPIGNAAVAYVQVCVVGAGCDTDDTAPYAFTVSASSGATTLRATAFDEAGGRATVDLPVTVVDTPPSVQLTAPTPGTQVPTGEPFAVTAAASPNPSSGSPVQHVTFELRDSGGNVVDFAEDYEAPFSVSMTTYEDGTHLISATATDANGLTSAPATVQVTAVTPALVLREGRFAIFGG
jgi:hypothetical protein